MKLEPAAPGKCWAVFYGSSGGQQLPRSEVRFPAPMALKIRIRWKKQLRPDTMFVSEPVLWRFKLAGYHLGEAVYVRNYPTGILASAGAVPQAEPLPED